MQNPKVFEMSKEEDTVRRDAHLRDYCVTEINVLKGNISPQGDILRTSTFKDKDFALTNL